MGGTTLHAGIVAQWFEILLLYLFCRYVTMVVSGILFGVKTPKTIPTMVLSPGSAPPYLQREIIW